MFLLIIGGGGINFIYTLAQISVVAALYNAYHSVSQKNPLNPW